MPAECGGDGAPSCVGEARNEEVLYGGSAAHGTHRRPLEKLEYAERAWRAACATGVLMGNGAHEEW